MTTLRRVTASRAGGRLLLVCSLILGIAIATTPAYARHKKTPPVPANIGPPTIIQALADTDPVWREAKKEVYKQVPDLVAQHQKELAAGLRYYKFMHGDLTKKEIALTFDDGPHPQFTPQLLKILWRNHVKATFFLVGEMAQKYPDLVEDEAKAGHSIGNHTYHHVNLTKIPEQYVATEIVACDDVILAITGKVPHLFRPPGGDYNTKIAEVSEQLKHRIILWTDDPGDYASPGTDVIVRRTMERIENGGIILIHDGVQQTVDLLPRLIKELKAQGYQFVTIDQMIKDSKPVGGVGRGCIRAEAGGTVRHTVNQR